ncbi:MAG TPA: helix-turn-helix domain-containing protein [Verrucomicrobiae bacterium]|nr:helix-turn-helix domain-containing protein [Verrucomicrobiae bacterium]
MNPLLHQLGLSDKEAAAYLTLLELGSASVQQLADATGIKRVTMYVVLERLEKLNLVKALGEGKRATFRAAHPGELERLVDGQIAELEAHRADLKSQLANLEALYNYRSDKPTVRYFEGKDGLIELDKYGEEQLEPGTVMYSITPHDIIQKNFPARRKDSVNYRVQKGIRSQVVYVSENQIPEAINKTQLRDAIGFKPDELDIKGTLTLFSGWGVKFFNYANGNFFGVLIQSPELADSLVKMFELAWDGAKARKQK